MPTLARHFVERFCRDLNKKALLFSPSALGELREHAWPGNVRELQNCIERAVILCDGDTILPRHLNLSLRRAESGRLDGAEGHESTATPAEDASPLARIDRSGTMAEAVRRVTAVVERLKLDGALRNARGNKARAAEALQISYKALLRKQREYGITD